MKEDKYTKLKKGKKEAKNANSKAGKCLGTVYIIHGWDGNVSKYWYPRTIKTLTEKGFKVYALEMPNPATPSIDEWVGYMKKKVKMDEKTFFIGHSIGCQTILRFLASQNMHAAGCIFVAGWFDLLEYTYTEEPKYEDIVRKIAASWINTPLDFAAAKKNSGMVTAEHPSASAKTGGNLIGNQQNLVCITKAAYLAKILRMVKSHAACTLNNGFENDRANRLVMGRQETLKEINIRLTRAPVSIAHRPV